MVIHIMKMFVPAFVLIMSAGLADSQISSGNFIGTRIGRVENAQEILAREQAQRQINQKAAILKNHIFRRVGGKIHNMIEDGDIMVGKCDSVASDGILILHNDFGRDILTVAVKNYSSQPVWNQMFEIVGIKSGIYDWLSSPIEIYDCGEQISAEDEQAQIEMVLKSRQALIDAKNKANRIHDFMAQSNAVVYLSSEATNGSQSAQFSLGEHYLNGQGCATNRELAIYWLKKATAGGSMEASNKLSQLK